MGNHGQKGLLERRKRLDIFRKHPRLNKVSCKRWRDPGRKVLTLLNCNTLNSDRDKIKSIDPPLQYPTKYPRRLARQ
jgi:hypothetical protein